jgi:hypothetical protein
MPDRPDHPTILIHIGIFLQRGTFLNICTFIHTYIFYAHGRVIGTQPAVTRGNCTSHYEISHLETGSFLTGNFVTKKFNLTYERELQSVTKRTFQNASFNKTEKTFSL